MVIVWRGKDKSAGERQLKEYILPADPEAELKKEGNEWIIEAKAILGSQPITVKKS